MSEHLERKSRRRQLKAAVIFYNGRHSTLPCAVRDMSDDGCRLTLQGSISAPDTFELFIELDGLWVPCEVVWRRGDTVGVKFTGPKTSSPPGRKQVVAAASPNNKPSIRRQPRS